MSDLDPKEVAETGRISLLMLIPNIVTLMGMSLGMTSIRFAIEGHYSTAALLIFLAAIADGFDGLLARRLGAVSEMGAQLDSLSDFLCFGVAPAILIYQVHLADTGGRGWIFALLFAGAACLRLARFNVAASKKSDPEAPKSSFTGVPAPAGAMLGLLPVFLTLAGAVTAGGSPIIVSIWLLFVGFFMISKLKTPSPNTITIPRKLIAFLLLAMFIIFGISFAHPWYLLVTLDVLYLAMLVFALFQQRGDVIEEM